MQPIVVNGIFHYNGTGSSPVVFVADEDQARLQEWWTENSVFTQMLRHSHPVTGVSCPVIYVSGDAVNQVHNGDSVAITVDLRPEQRGNGIRTVQINPVANASPSAV